MAAVVYDVAYAEEVASHQLECPYQSADVQDSTPGEASLLGENTPRRACKGLQREEEDTQEEVQVGDVKAGGDLDGEDDVVVAVESK